MTGRAWQDRPAALAPAGSYLVAEAKDRLLASSAEQAIWLSFVANEVSCCEKAGGKLPR